MKTRIIIITLISLSYLFGTASYKYNLFPLSIYRSINQKNPTDFSCPISDDRNASLVNFHQHSNFKDFGLLLGDSLIQGMYDPRPYGLDNFIAIGQDRQTSECLSNEIDRFIDLKPREILLYIGGNDIDRQVPESDICANIDSITKTVKSSGISLKLHEIHYGLKSSRNPDSVSIVNKCINDIANKYGISTINTLSSFKFNTLEDSKTMSTDGEHLDHLGYSVWVQHLKKKLENNNKD